MSQYDRQKHRRAFEATLDTAMARQFHGPRRRCSPWFRRRVQKAVVKRLPSVDAMAAHGPEWTLRQIESDPDFAVEVGSIWMMLFTALVAEIIKAIIAHWYATKEIEGQVEL